jgi:predicted TIM-barrel fold metal-dependent hydrolase
MASCFFATVIWNLLYHCHFLFTMVATPAGMWDTHVHCFDPESYPFKATRAYTPGPALLEELVGASQSNRIVLVQASIENGHQGLIAHLQRIRAEHPNFLARGIMCISEDWERITNDHFDFLDDLGIRSCRIHGLYGDGAGSPSSIEEQFRRFARSYSAKKCGWSLSVQLPLRQWASLRDFLLHDPEMKLLTIIVDHQGCAAPSDVNTTEFDAFIDLLQSGRFYVKLSALYRRSAGTFHEMRPLVQGIANAAKEALLWGSDWPHVDSGNRSLAPQTNLENIDLPAELSALQNWMTQEQWHSMLVENPERLFGQCQ